MSKTSKWFLSAVALTLVSFIDSECPAQNTSDAGTSGPSASATPPRAALPAHFQATVYEVQTTPEQAASLDGKALAGEAATAETLLKSLSEKGTARILYRIDQPVNAADERIEISAKEPVVTGTRLAANGSTINSVTYQNVGVLFQLSTRDPLGAQRDSSRGVGVGGTVSHDGK